MKISIVIPNYNGKELLEKNLPHVLNASNNPKNKILEVVVVDDGSNDDSVSFLNSQFKDKIKLIKHSKNRGFSSAVNTGVRSTKGDLVVLLNSDVSPDSKFLETVVPIFEDKKVFSVSFHEKGYGPSKGLFAEGYMQQPSGTETKKVTPTFYTSGGSGAFRKSIWKELGGMDEKLLSPLYWEDIDLSYRASKRDYINLWDPNANVVHVHMSTVSKLPKKKVDMIRERNQLLMLWKNIHSKNLMRKHINAILTRTLKHPGYLKVIIFALFRLPIALRGRAKEIKESVVSDEAVFQKYSWYTSFVYEIEVKL